MGAAEAGREVGDVGGPVLVGAFGLISLTAGLGALAAILLACAALAALRNRASLPIPRSAPSERRPAAPPYPYLREDWSR
jgi:hypothetical protein